VYSAITLTQTEEDIAEWNGTYKTKLPTFTVLITLVAKEYRRSGYNTPAAYFLAFIFIPHFWTLVGTNCWYFMFYNYLTFPCVCLGVWDEQMVTMFRIRQKINQFVTDVQITDANMDVLKANRKVGVYVGVVLGDAPAATPAGEREPPKFDSEMRTQVSSLLSAIVGTRAILFMLLPFCSLITTFAVATAGCPILLHNSETLRALLPPLFIPNSRDIAIERLQRSGSTVYRSSWIVYFTSWSIMVSESRFIQFLVATSKWFLAISILFFPDQTFLAICFGILANYCAFNSLGVIAHLAVLMRIKCETNHDPFCRGIPIPFLLKGVNSEGTSFGIASWILFGRDFFSEVVAYLLYFLGLCLYGGLK